ncbi:M1 family metallopeptidase [Tenacibaculum sp. SG-28]|uniref:M1 family metallopeptidase n=1 Tax=Tenacibaculum sp. SG-28 TaxID=754426 RepID=UPI001E588C87|nr:hypothetical protein [Tenacibaculum sp. SG-28]
MTSRKISVLFFLFFIPIHFIQSQHSYKAAKDIVNSLVHTKLKVGFNFEEKTLQGEEWVTLKPHFYDTKTLELDAKAMLIHEISMDEKPLEYTYDNLKIKIELPKVYQRDQEYTIYIKYTARPEKVQQKGSAAITSAKGLYFINPSGLDTEKPTQIWTQGETESSSCWFPTIDAPNQKTSQELYITVPNKFVTLSNGTLEKQIENTNGTRTDYWNFTKKHAPYLFLWE